MKERWGTQEDKRIAVKENCCLNSFRDMEKKMVVWILRIN